MIMMMINDLQNYRPLMPRDNGLDGTYLRREKQKKEKSVKVAKSNEKVSKGTVKNFHYDVGFCI